MSRSFILFTLVSIFTLSVGGPARADFDIDKIKDGLPAPRQGSAPGVLWSRFQDPKAIEYQNALNSIESKIYGLSKHANRTEIFQAEIVFYLETLLVGVIQDIISDSSIKTDFERQALEFRAIRMYRDVRHHAERLFDFMIRTIDTAKPGTSGIQLPQEVRPGEVVYSPNYRFEHELTPSEMKIAYDKKLAEFQSSGGKLSEVQILSVDTIKPLGKIMAVEFVQMQGPNREIRFTAGKAGHILMARGEKVRAAGTMLLVKNRAGELGFVVVSNSSGSFKPDMLSVGEFMRDLSRQLNLPLESIVLTKGEPMSSQVVKILMKAKGSSEQEIKNRISKIKDTSTDILASPMEFVEPTLRRQRACRLVFE